MTQQNPASPDGEWVMLSRDTAKHLLDAFYDYSVVIKHKYDGQEADDCKVCGTWPAHDLGMGCPISELQSALEDPACALAAPRPDAVRFIDLKSLWKALEDLGIDNGWHPDPAAVIPPEWEERCRCADAQIGRMSDEERQTFVGGEETEMEAIKEKYIAQAAHDVLNAAFDDGPLTFLQSVHTTAVEHVAYESSVLLARSDRPDADAKLAEIQKRLERDQQLGSRRDLTHHDEWCVKDRAYLIPLAERAASLEHDLLIAHAAIIILKKAQAMKDRKLRKEAERGDTV